MTLFPAQSGVAPASSRCVRRGRGATPRTEKHVDLDKPNPCRRLRLRYRYRPLRAWTPEQIDLAERGLLYYFRRVGGFRIADDSLMRAFIGCLDYVAEDAAELGVAPAVVIGWAIDAKSASLRGDTAEDTRSKATYRGCPDTFFTPARIDQWLDQSKDCMDRRAARQAAQRVAARSNVGPVCNRSTERDRAWQLAGTEHRDRRGREFSSLELRLLAFWTTIPTHGQLLAMATQRGRDHMPPRDPEDPTSDFRRDLCRIRAAKFYADAKPDQWQQVITPSVAACVSIETRCHN